MSELRPINEIISELKCRWESERSQMKASQNLQLWELERDAREVVQKFQAMAKANDRPVAGLINMAFRDADYHEALGCLLQAIEDMAQTLERMEHERNR